MMIESHRSGALIQATLRFMVRNFHSNISLDDVANHIGVSKFHLCRLFKSSLNTTPISWLWTFRVVLSAEIIFERPIFPIRYIGKHCGFNNEAHFSRLFKELLEIRPSSLMKAARKQKFTVHGNYLYKSFCNEEMVKRAFEKTMQRIMKVEDQNRSKSIYENPQQSISYPIRL